MQHETQPVSPQARLISHAGDLPRDDATLLASIKARLGQDPARSAAEVERLLQLLDALWEVELGRFLLRNRGLDASWTHRLVTHPPGSLAREATPALEYALFETLPAVLATRERFGIFRAQLQALLRPGMTLASVPCGWMGDVLSLDYRQCPEVQLLGIDLDPQALEGALKLARQYGLEGRLSLRLEDAWTQGDADSVDVLTSNGLNLYEPDDARVIALYRAFFHRLRPGGTLLTSFLTPPPSLCAHSPWQMTLIDPAALALQSQIFVDIVQARWASFRTHAQTRGQLESAGFADIRFIDDRASLFPTVIAHKPAKA
ncbi:class I SAM-dependent methyltransferase [Xanthomonas sp. NCPPB 1067]|uniref:SAM-dependent methyltransferase n=1 Tax=Xanthomonas melonis TaxID=56456 RepID=A0A2S7DDC4_9XANT|nr:MULTISPECIES: class I SAM-dependent methyltransferase [Xanthomonas]MCC4588103.1 class I SAM-dependent methyltransferase [Xanthomonas sp. NCPPB 1067]MCC4601274.1 class I SAM-dependent methyltransferase [Xanthomonas melonis]PPU71826.1 SAM-dependent methyltransferase [Xanthomonas melonis]